MELIFYWKRLWASAKRFRLVWLFLVYLFISFVFLKFRWLGAWPMLLMIAATFLFSWWFYKKVDRAIFLSFLSAQIFWALLFSPLGYVSIAGVLFVFYLSIFDILERGDYLKNAALLLIALFLILLSSKWGI